jgi:hypothetical protein
MHCTLVRNGFCPLCYGEGGRRRRKKEKKEEPIICSRDKRFFSTSSESDNAESVLGYRLA